MSLTVLRSPIYAHHDPLIPESDGHYSFIDQGIQHFNYSLLPHEDSWEEALTVKHAAVLNQRPVALIETYHEGVLPQKDSYVEIDQDNVIISAIKQAEDNEDIILRCYETNKVATKATIKLPKWGRTIEVSFKPCEIKTYRIPKDASKPVIETNLLEWEE